MHRLGKSNLISGARTYGMNLKAIAEVIGTKTESHIRSFFVNYKRRYNLDAALKEYEAEHGPTQAEDMVSVEVPHLPRVSALVRSSNDAQV